MNVKTLEEEHQALLADRAGEIEYLHSLLQQFEKLKVDLFVSIFLFYFLEDKMYLLRIEQAFRLALGTMPMHSSQDSWAITTRLRLFKKESMGIPK